MDKLDVIRKAERLGGGGRRQSLIDLMIHARKLGCNMSVGGGQAGGINFRFGTIGHAIIDVKTTGAVKVYVDPHPGDKVPEALWNELNAVIGANPDMNPKSYPVNTYSILKNKIEDIPQRQLERFVTEAVGGIWETYYEPHIKSHQAMA